MALTEELPEDVPAEILEKRVTPVQLEIQDLPTEVVEPDVITTVTKRTLKIVRAVQHEIEEMPTETVRDITGEEIPSELTLKELTTPKMPAAEVSMPNVYVAPKAKKPTTKWEAPETLEVVIEKPQDTKIAVTEVVKPEETVTEEIEVLPEQATSTAQIALYETTKPTVSMTFKVPEELKPKGIKGFNGGMTARRFTVLLLSLVYKCLSNDTVYTVESLDYFSVFFTYRILFLSVLPPCMISNSKDLSAE